MSYSQDGEFGSESDPYNEDRYEIDDQESDSYDGSNTDDDTPPVHDDSDSDTDRFNPTEGETNFTLEGGMAAYCRKYFFQHLTEESVKRNILDDSPVPV